MMRTYSSINGIQVDPYQAPSSLKSLMYASGSVKKSTQMKQGECSICLDAISLHPAVELKGCGHAFHEKCLHQCIDAGNMSCPMCRKKIGDPQGFSPTGTMQIETISKRCPGFHRSTKCIQISYNIPSGTQLPYHQNPGYRYHHTNRTSYLPDNQEGRALLCRLRYAWKHGLIFKIGTSQTSGRSNSVVWSTIPHKTSLHSGIFGFPDAGYTATCNQELDKLGVPNAQSCLASQPARVPVSTTLPSAPVAPQASAPSPRASAHPPPSAPPDFHQFNVPLGLDPSDPRAFQFLVSSLFGSPMPNMQSTSNVQGSERIAYIAPESIVTENLAGGFLPVVGGAGEQCPICFDALSEKKSIRLKACNHQFHEECAISCLGAESKCPICRVRIGKIQGQAPSGTMSIMDTPINCPGFGCSTLQITYEIPSGIQKSYHESPGSRYSGTVRVAFLPNNLDGQSVMKRLKYAWKHGLTFQIGTSLTTGMRNVVVWTSIHHKTCLNGGMHGFPDPNYIINVNSALSALGVPEANSCGEGAGE